MLIDNKQWYLEFLLNVLVLNIVYMIYIINIVANESGSGDVGTEEALG